MSPANYVPFKATTTKATKTKAPQEGKSNTADKKFSADTTEDKSVDNKGDNNQKPSTASKTSAIEKKVQSAIKGNELKQTKSPVRKARADAKPADVKKNESQESQEKDKEKEKPAESAQNLATGESSKPAPSTPTKKASKSKKIFNKNTPSLPSKTSSLVKRKLVKKSNQFVKPQDKSSKQVTAAISKNDPLDKTQPKDIYDFHESGSGSEPLSPIPVQETTTKKAPIYKRKSKPKDQKTDTETEKDEDEPQKSEVDSSDDFKTPLAKLKAAQAGNSNKNQKANKKKVNTTATKANKVIKSEKIEIPAAEIKSKQKKSLDNKEEDKKSDSEQEKQKIAESSEDDKKNNKKMTTPAKKGVKAKKPPEKPKQQPKQQQKVTTDEESDEDTDSDDSVVTRIQQKRAAKTRHMKKYGFWGGPKRHREASLNALAKVHFMYESESRSAMEQNLIKAAKLESLKDLQKVQKAAEKNKKKPNTENDDAESQESDTEKEEENTRYEVVPEF